MDELADASRAVRTAMARVTNVGLLVTTEEDDEEQRAVMAALEAVYARIGAWQEEVCEGWDAEWEADGDVPRLWHGTWKEDG